MPPTTEDLDLSQSFRALRRSLALLVVLSVLAAVATYSVFKNQKPLYEGEIMILSAGTQTGNQRVNDTLVSAPPLPPGAIKGVLNSKGVQGVVIGRLNEIPELDATQREVLKAALYKSIASGKNTVLSISGQSDLFGNGTFVLSAVHENPAVAAQLANLAGDSLLAWDARRGLVKVTSAAEVLRLEVADIQRRLDLSGLVGLTRTPTQQGLLAQRSDRLDALNRLMALQKAVVGSLTIVAPAATPITAIAPKPLRNGVLVGAFTFVLLSAGVMVWASLNRRVTSDNDIKGLGLRLIGEIPRLRTRRRGRSLLVTLRQSRWSDSVSFLSAGLRSVLPPQDGRASVVLVTSVFSGDGKSSVTAAIADARATHGDRVLLIDADLRRPTQVGLWQMAAHAADWVNLPGANPFPNEESRDVVTSLATPDIAQARRLREHLHLIAPKTTSSAQGQISSASFCKAIERWRGSYDLILVDCPPALAMADTLTLAPHVDGVLLVLEAGRAPVASVQRLMDALLLVDANVVGVALNKVNPRDTVARYGYGYDQRYDANAYRTPAKVRS